MRKLVLTAMSVVVVALATGKIAQASVTPEVKEKQLIAKIKKLVVPLPYGWEWAKDYKTYARYRRQLREVRRIIHEPYYAIMYVFGRYGQQAWRVSLCEAGRPVPSVHAHNGQYLGLFQMGSSERHLYGHGYTPLAQARAAYRYFASSGYDWSPWGCKP